MSDKTRELYPLAALFGPGEQPSAAKMTAISTQAKAGIDKLSYIVGDLWNAAGDQILSPSGNVTKNALHIPNIARAIGRLEGLNPIVPNNGATHGPMSNTMSYVDSATESYVGFYEGILTYLPAATPSSGNMILGGTFAPLVQIQFKTTPFDVQITGDWCVDANGRLYTFDPIPGGMTLTYTPSIQTGMVSLEDGEVEPGWNVIPDPSTWSGAYSGLKISFANNTDATTGYHIWLPPRKALNSAVSFNSPDASINTQALPDSGTLEMFQDITSDAALTNGNHYRYNLPAAITGAAANSQLPTGYLYLWDETFGTIVDNIAYFIPANTAHSKFKVRVVGADLVNVFGDTVGAGILTADNTQLPADYIARFKLIVVGTSLSKAVSNLLYFIANHGHKGVDGSKPVSHSDLNNLVTPASVISTGLGPVPALTPSRLPNDDHYQYLHRFGTNGDTGSRDSYDNAMFNWLRILNPNGDTFGPGDAILDFQVADYFGTATTAFAQIKASNCGLNLSTVGTHQSTAWTTARVGVFIGEQDHFGWTGVSINNGDSLSIRGGGATGIAQIVNGQFQRMYLGLDTTFIKQSCYLDWDNADEILTLVGTGPQVTFETSHVFADTDMSAPLFIADTNFKYTAAKIQYLTVGAPEFAVPQGATVSTGQVLSNLDTGAAINLFAIVHFPNGAVLNPSTTNCTVYSIANGTTGVTVTLQALAKPTSSGYSPSLSSTNLVSSGTPSSHVTEVTACSYLSSHTVDNSFTGNIYQLIIALPAKIGSNVPELYGVTFSYEITNVSN